MLLEELLKPGCAACVSEEEHSALKEALEGVSKVAEFCNASIARHNQFLEWVTIHAQFGDSLPFSYDRKLVKEGAMTKINRRGQPQRKYVILFTDALVYGKANAEGALAKVRIALCVTQKCVSSGTPHQPST